MNLLRWIQNEVSLLSVGEERRLLKLAQRGCRSAQRSLLQAYLPLIARLSRRQCRRGVDIGDLIAAGVVALAAAIRKISPDQGTRLSSYAYQMIVRAIREEVDFSRRMIRLPRPAELSYGQRRAEICPDPQRLEDRQKALRPVLTLDAGELPLGPIIADRRDDWAELEHRDEVRWIREQVRALPERERAAIEAEYFQDGKLQDVGPRFGCGRAAGSKWHRRGIERLRQMVG